jgi:assimilatory nitrate reductase catalytic subunit
VIVSAPDANALRTRLDALDFLLVADAFLSETAALADVVLPVTHWAEEEGTMTNLEGRVILRRRALAPPEGVRTDLEILELIAAHLGRGQYIDARPAVVFEELRRASAGGLADYSGISYARIAAEQRVFWPCPSEAHAGSPRIFLDRFATAAGRARFHAVDHRPPAEEPDGEYPLYLTTGRVLTQYQSGTQTRRVRSLNDGKPQAFVQIHPQMARHFGVADDSLARVVSRRGAALVRVRYSTEIRMDPLFIPFHWGGVGSANRLTIASVDQVSRIPEFKVCAARIEPADAPERDAQRPEGAPPALH